LNDGASPEGVFLWLAGYNISTYTNQDGEFQVLLPPQPKQVSATGTVEHDTLYFYLANYLLETARVMIVDGEFFYAREDIDKDGKVRGPIVMQRFLQISTYVTPPIVPIDFSDTIFVKTQLQADISCAEVGIPKVDEINRKSNERPLGAILVKKLDSEQVFIVRSDSLAEGNYVETVCRNTVILELKFVFAYVQLPPGVYEVIPYLWITPKGAPQGLLEKLGSHVNELGRNYLQKPMRRKDGSFEVMN
ncbi:MAG: hypothetical protein ACE5HI_19235, partial [bacterium]